MSFTVHSFKKGKKIMRMSLIVSLIAWCSAVAFSDVNDTAGTASTCAALKTRIDTLETRLAKMEMHAADTGVSTAFRQLGWGTGAFTELHLSNSGFSFDYGYLFPGKKRWSVGPFIGAGPYIGSDAVPSLAVTGGICHNSPILANIVSFKITNAIVGAVNRDTVLNKTVYAGGIRTGLSVSLWASGKNAFNVGYKFTILGYKNEKGFVEGGRSSAVEDISWTHYFGKKLKRNGK
jgi:hypothetical protein